MASNLKVDIVRPTATNGSLSLKGDSGGSATTNGVTVNSSGNTSITGTTTVSSLVATTINAGDGAAATPSITNTGDTNTGIYFPAANTVGVSTNGSERMRIDSSGNIELKTTNAKLILPSGGGIDFGTSTTGSGTVTPTVGGLLDDYEEGTWTGSLQTGNNNISGSNLSSTGKYIKIGNLVFFSIYLNSVTITSGTGSLRLSGLPFNSESSYHTWVNYGYGNLLTSSNGGYVQVGNNYINFIQRDSTNAAAYSTGSAKSAMVSGTYVAA